MKSKILLLTIAVLSVGLFAMPTTLSLFNGQHTFVSSSNVSCAGCHADIASELQNTKSYTVGNPTALTRIHLTALNASIPGTQGQGLTTDTNNACLACHARSSVTINIIPLSSYNSSTNNYTRANNTNAHAATAIACVACHNAYLNDTAISGTAQHPFTNGTESHAPFVYQNMTQTIYINATNVACIGCHTLPAGGNYVNITRSAKRLTINVTEDISGNYGTWGVVGNST